MLKKVLIVDDDQDMLLSLQEGLSKFNDTLSVLLAEDGLIATQKLKEDTISLVVTDLKMPRIDGFSLLSHIMQHYHYIPVIVMTAYSTPKIKQLAQRGGAVGYIEKPFLIEDLARQATTTLRKESEGGTLHSVSSGMFLQLIEMEERTCTIRLFDNHSKRQGILFFKGGELIDASTEGVTGELAAYKIFSWDKVNLSIENTCSQNKRTINSDLQAIFLHAMQLKDESAKVEEPKTDAETVPKTGKISEKKIPKALDPVDGVWNKLEKELGEHGGVENVYHDSSWDGFLAQLNEVGASFNAGRFIVGHVDKGELYDFILLPGNVATVVTVSPKSPRDKILQILSR